MVSGGRGGLQDLRGRGGGGGGGAPLLPLLVARAAAGKEHRGSVNRPPLLPSARRTTSHWRGEAARVRGSIL